MEDKYIKNEEQEITGETPYPEFLNQKNDSFSFEYTKCRRTENCEYENCPYRRDLFMFN